MRHLYNRDPLFRDHPPVYPGTLSPTELARRKQERDDWITTVVAYLADSSDKYAQRLYDAYERLLPFE